MRRPPPELAPWVSVDGDHWMWARGTGHPYRRRAYAMMGRQHPKRGYLKPECGIALCVRHLAPTRHALRVPVYTPERRVLHAPKNPARGEKHGRSKLAASQVRDIRARFGVRSTAPRAVDVAREFGVTPALIRLLVRREIWRHVP